mgnify:FL=1
MGKPNVPKDQEYIIRLLHTAENWKRLTDVQQFLGVKDQLAAVQILINTGHIVIESCCNALASQKNESVVKTIKLPDGRVLEIRTSVRQPLASVEPSDKKPGGGGGQPS